MTDYLDDLFDIIDDVEAEKEEVKWSRGAFSMIGGKTKSLKHIIPELPITKDTVWVDHCAGTGVVSFNIKPGKINVINDRYSAITDFYLSIRDHFDEFITYLERFPWHSRQQWVESHKKWNKHSDPVRRAAHWFYYWRSSVLGKGKYFGRGLTYPFNPMKDVFELLPSIRDKLRLFTLENLDIRKCIEDYDSLNTVHYIDTPYVNTDQGTYAHKWTEKDMKSLLNLLAGCKGFVALSHIPYDLIDEQDFWTDKKVWDVVYTAEPKIAKEGNYKTQVDGNMNQFECLWIKEASA